MVKGEQNFVKFRQNRGYSFQIQKQKNYQKLEVQDKWTENEYFKNKMSWAYT